MKRDRGNSNKLALPLAVSRLLKATGRLIEVAEAIREIRDELLTILRQTPVDTFDTDERQTDA